MGRKTKTTHTSINMNVGSFKKAVYELFFSNDPPDTSVIFTPTVVFRRLESDFKSTFPAADILML